MESSWWDERSACPKAGSKSSNNKSKLSLSAVAGIFYILILGMTTAIACSLLEYLYFKHREKQYYGSDSDGSTTKSGGKSEVKLFPSISKSSSNASISSCRPIISKSRGFVRNVSFQEDVHNQEIVRYDDMNSNVLENYEYMVVLEIEI